MPGLLIIEQGASAIGNAEAVPVLLSHANPGTGSWAGLVNTLVSRISLCVSWKRFLSPSWGVRALERRLMGMSLSLRSWPNSAGLSTQHGAGAGVLLTTDPAAGVGRGF